MIFVNFESITKKYKVIYVDCPWPYNDKLKHSGGSAESHYNTMTIDQLKALPVGSIADNDCVLFHWCTFPLLKEGIDVMESWGFKYKTLGFSWIKMRNGKPFFGIGHYTKSNCEVCLIGITGKPQVKNNKVSSAILADLEEHSKKPDIIRDKITQVFGNVPRIELFARTETEGWDVFGNQIKGSTCRGLDPFLT